MNPKLLFGGVVLACGAAIVWMATPSAPDPPKPDEPDPHQETPKKPAYGELDKTKQKAVWDAEHLTFQIEQRFGKAFLKAIQDRNAKKLRTFFREEFAGALPKSHLPQTAESGLISTQRTPKNTEFSPATASDIVASLVGHTRDLEKFERKMFRVLKIERAEKSDRWKTKVLTRYFGPGKDKSLVLREAEHFVEFVVNDPKKIDSGAVISGWKTIRTAGRSSERKLMEEVTQKRRLHEVPLPDNWKLPTDRAQRYRFQMAAADFDRDGHLDIAIAALGSAPMLLRSVAGKHFTDVAEEVGLESKNLFDFACAWIDYDNDGFPDLVLGDRLYKNENGKSFRDVTRDSGLRFDFECMGCAVADYDCDGRLDLYVLYQRFERERGTGKTPAWVGETDSGKSNRLFRNLGNGKFQDVTDETGAGGGRRHSFAAAWFFHDEDHFPDLYIANDFGGNVVLRNKGDGTFEDISEKTGAADYATSMGVVAGDVNNDGKTDLYVANMYSKMGRRIIGQVCAADYPQGVFEQIQGSCAGNRLYLQKGKTYTEAAEKMEVDAAGWAHGVTMADFDSDGFLDLYSTAGYMSFHRTKPDG